MSRESLRDTDAYILRDFEQAVVHLRYREADSEMQAEMRKLAEPFLERLKRKGHSFKVAISLLKEVFDHQPPSKDHPVPRPGIYH